MCFRGTAKDLASMPKSPNFPARLAIVVLNLCLFAAVPLPVSAGEETQHQKKTLGPLEKSLLLPGWGQISEKRFIEGIFFLAAEAACLCEIVSNNHLGNENYARYKAAESMDDAVYYRGLTVKYDKRRNQALLAGAAVWAANLLDIYLIVKNKKQKDARFELKISRGEHYLLGLDASCRF
jgi:hypothetical protein